MLTTVITILPVFLIVAAGYAAGRLKLLGPDATSILNRFVIWLALPCLLFEIVATTDWDRLWNTRFVLVSVVGSLLVFGLGLIVGRLRGLELQDSVIDGLNAGYANASYAGFPLLLLVIGPVTKPYVTIVGTLTLMTLFGVAIVLMEMARHQGHGLGRGLRRAGIGILRNPVLIGPLLGTLWWLTGVPLPHPVESAVSLLGNAASPAALVAIGLFLAQRPLVQTAANRFVGALTVLKLIVHPAITAVLAWYVFVLPPQIATIAIALAALPTGTGPFMITEFYARDGKVTAGTILATTLASVITLAAILSLLGIGVGMTAKSG